MAQQPARRMDFAAEQRRGDNPQAARRRSRLDALDRHTEMLDKDVETLAGAVEALRDEFQRLADLQAEALRAWERRLSAVESQQAAGTVAGPPGVGHDGVGGNASPQQMTCSRGRRFAKMARDRVWLLPYWRASTAGGLRLGGLRVGE